MTPTPTSNDPDILAEQTPIVPAPTGEAAPAPAAAAAPEVVAASAPVTAPAADAAPAPAPTPEVVADPSAPEPVAEVTPAAAAAAPEVAPVAKVPAIVPTVGRVVLFSLESGKNKGEVRPALITRVWGPLCVQLSVLTEINDGLKPVEMRSSAMLSQSGDAELGKWHWMPFQLGQAAKVVDEVTPLRKRIAALEDALVDLGERIGHHVKI